MASTPADAPLLTVRVAQLPALSPGHDRLCAALCTELAGAFPHRFSGARAPELAAFVDATIELALSHGVTLARDVGVLAWLRAAHGDAFEWNPVGPEALELLHATDLPGPIKVAAMMQCLNEASGGRPIVVASTAQE